MQLFISKLFFVFLPFVRCLSFYLVSKKETPVLEYLLLRDTFLQKYKWVSLVQKSKFSQFFFVYFGTLIASN